MRENGHGRNERPGSGCAHSLEKRGRTKRTRVGESREWNSQMGERGPDRLLATCRRTRRL